MSLIYLYSHDGEGLGHLRRSLNIARAITEAYPETSAVILTGSVMPGAFGLPANCDFIKIPSLTKVSNSVYISPLAESSGLRTCGLRESLLTSTVMECPPDILIVDKHPCGLDGELLNALKWLRREKPETRIVLGLRDILDDPSTVEREWRGNGSLDAVRDLYDRIWIYSDENVYRTADAYSFSPHLRLRGVACGYLIAELCHATHRPSDSPFIVGMVGGGHDGRSVLEETLASAERLRRDYPSLRVHLVAGPLMPETDYRCLRSRVAADSPWSVIERFSHRLIRMIREAAAVVTMGGYNSLLECVAMGIPTVVVPREYPRREQFIRAEVFKNLGVLRVCRQVELREHGLDNHLRSILSGEWRPQTDRSINMDGYRTILSEVETMLQFPNEERCHNAAC